MAGKPKHTVAKLREERGWSQDDLVRKTGLSKGTIQNVERGRDFYVSTLVRLAQTFGVSIEVIIAPWDGEERRVGHLTRVGRGR